MLAVVCSFCTCWVFCDMSLGYIPWTCRLRRKHFRTKGLCTRYKNRSNLFFLSHLHIVCNWWLNISWETGYTYCCCTVLLCYKLTTKNTLPELCSQFTSWKFIGGSTQQRAEIIPPVLMHDQILLIHSQIQFAHKSKFHVSICKNKLGSTSKIHIT